MPGGGRGATHTAAVAADPPRRKQPGSRGLFNTPRERCVGGRMRVREEQQHFKNVLAGGAPKAGKGKGVDSSEPESRAARRRLAGGGTRVEREGRQRAANGVDPFGEVRETYRRVEALSSHGAARQRARAYGTSPAAAASASSLAARLSENRRRAQRIANSSEREHARRVAHMHRRMEARQSVTERKKNAFDATLYPAKLRRNDKVISASVSIATPRRRPASARPASKARPGSARRPASASAKPARPASSRPASARPASARPAKGKVRVIESADPYRDFKRSMLDAIVTHRVYEAGRLAELFESYLRLNSSAHRDVIQRAIADVKAELELAI